MIREPEATGLKMLDDITQQSQVDEKSIVLDVRSISPSEFIQIDDESGNETKPKQVKTEICPVSDQVCSLFHSTRSSRQYAVCL